MGRLTGFGRSYWGDLRDFWLSQIVVGILLVLFAAGLDWWIRYRFPNLREKWWENLLPYGLIIAIFLMGNAIRTVYRIEKGAFKKKEHLEKRRLAEEIKEEIRASEVARLPNPNLHFRRIYQAQIFVGHALGGRGYTACLVEIGNELGENTGYARSVKAHVIYRESKKTDVLHTECPARWSLDNEETTSIPVGEGRSFVLAAFDLRDGSWSTASHGGMGLKGSFDMQAKILSSDGKSIGETLNFTFSWDGGYSSPKFQRA